MRTQIKQLLFALIPFTCILTVLCLVKYIDLSVIVPIYLPIFLISALIIMLKKYYAGHIFIISAEIGLILEYIMSLNYAGSPNMLGAFLNISILFSGLVIGIIVQIYINKILSSKYQK